MNQNRDNSVSNNEQYLETKNKLKQLKKMRKTIKIKK